MPHRSQQDNDAVNNANDLREQLAQATALLLQVAGKLDLQSAETVVRSATSVPAVTAEPTPHVS